MLSLLHVLSSLADMVEMSQAGGVNLVEEILAMQPGSPPPLQQQQQQQQSRDRGVNKSRSAHVVVLTRGGPCECPICLAAVGASAAPDCCGHAFCEPCLRRWVKERATCPWCRADLTREEPGRRTDDSSGAGAGGASSPA